MHQDQGPVRQHWRHNHLLCEEGRQGQGRGGEWGWRMLGMWAAGHGWLAAACESVT